MQQQMQQHWFRPGFTPVASMHIGGQAASQNCGDILVITDMQRDYKAASNQRLLQNVCNLIDYAIARNWVIVVLEVVGAGETLEPIRQRLACYDNWFPVKK